MENSRFITQIQDLIVKDDLDKALQQLRQLLNDSPRLSEAIHHAGRFADLQRQIRLGIVDHESATLSKNQIRLGLLDLLNELEGRGTDSGIKIAAKSADVIQQAEKIYNIGHIDNANFS